VPLVIISSSVFVEKAEALTLAQIENGRRFVLDYFKQQRKEP